ncbi:MAG: hypothetical protein IPO67_05600 [Deltaproteobacteria bacterium]|nr:hypothetical protein [Deltaproteobacteria bacterium]
MPELTEVEAFARAMTRWCGGRKVTALRLLDPTVQHTVERDVLGMTVRSVGRRGKHLILSLDDAELMIHLRMTGQLLPGEGAAFVRFVLHVQDAAPVQLIDPRRLAELHVLAPGGAARRLQGLGDEPYPELHPGLWWQTRLGHTRRPLKAALMDQALVAGLGNIAASEILWRAKLHPTRAANTLTEPEWSALAAAVHGFLHALMSTQDPERLVYIHRGGENPFSVYQRTRCPRCEGALARLTQQARSTYLCPRCQPAPLG